MRKKVFAMLLTAALCVGMLPTSVLAEGEQSDEGIDTEEIVEMSAKDVEEQEDSDASVNESDETEENKAVTAQVEPQTVEKTEKSDAEDDTNEPKEYKYEGNTVNVTASLPADSEVPSDAELKVTSVDEENEDYDDLMENAEDVIADGEIGEILFYDISLYSADGDYLKVEDKATVTIEFKKDAFSGEGSTHVLHFNSKNDNKAKDISGVNKKENDDGDVKAVNFDTDGFSVFAVADVIPLAEGDADLFINYAHIDLGYSGTAPFDVGSGNTDGNDENAENDIIRSFDRAGYDLTVDIDSKSESSDAKAVRIHFEVNIQGSNIENKFYTQGFSWADHYELSDTETGHKIIGYYDYKDDAGVTASQKSGLSMVVQVLAMSDGMILQPTGKVWLEELDENGNGTNALSEAVDIGFPALEISAKLQLNVYLYRGGTNVTSVEGTFDFASSGVDVGYINYDKGTSIYGRMYGYGIALEMYNTTTGKGMKGQALPDGETIDLSINLNSTFAVATDYGGGTLDLSTYEDGNYQLLFYALEGNTPNNSTCEDGRSLISVEGDHPSDYYSSHVPYNKATSNQLGVTGVENGGDWKAVSQNVTKDGTTIKIQVSSYEITQLVFPYAYPANTSATDSFYTNGTAVEDINCAVFSAGELWLIQPYSYVDSTGATHDLSLEAGKGTFTIQVQDGVVDETAGIYVKGSYDSYDKNVQRNGEGNITAPLADENGKIDYGTKTTSTIDTQVKNDDDDATQTADINPPGNFQNEIKYINTTKNNAFTNVQGVTEIAGYGTGVSYATLGSEDVSVCGGFSYTPNTRSNIPAAANIMIKFDASALSIKDEDWLSFPRYDGFSNDPTDYNIFFGYLNSGENWASDTEMQEADEDDLTWLNERKSDATCVAVLFEYRFPGSITSLTRPRPSLKMNVLTDSDLSGNVYMTTEVTRLWTVSDVAEIYNKENGANITYSDVLGDTDGDEYIKTSIPSVTDYLSTYDLPTPSYGYGSGGNYNTPMKGTVYQKKQYNEGAITGHNGGDYYGDSLLILDYTSDINIKIAQEAVDQQTGNIVDKSIYNFDNVERIADLEIIGKMEIQNSVVTESWGDTITTITVTVPEGASYKANSAQYGIADSEGNFDITYTQSSTMGQQGTISNGTSFEQTTSEAEYEAWLADETITTGGMLYIKTNADGSQELVFSVKGVPIQGTDVVKIYFSVELGDESDPEKDLKADDSLTFDATIRTTEDKDRALSGANGNEDTTTILITETGSNTFSKYAVNELTEVNEDLSWIIRWDNTSSDTAAMCEILDDMPDTKESYSDDYPYASDYHGTYAITGFQIDLNQISATDAQKLVVYYTMDSQYEGDELVLEHDGDESKLDITWDEITTQWSPLNVKGDGTVDFSSVYEYENDSAGNITGVKNHVYAWAIGGYVPAGEGVHITLTIHQYGAQGGDYMTNVAYDSTGSSVFHRAATIYRALRTISGTVWLDEDMDGGINTGVYGNEQKINGVQVQLQIWNDDIEKWEDAEDVYGENFDITTQLDPKGYYEFTNLGAGTYRVLFADNETGKYEQPYMLSEHTLTNYEASGIPGAYNSKAQAYESNSIWPFAAEDYQGVISDIEMPALGDMTVYDYVYEVPYQNAGYTKPQELDVTKTWIGADGKEVTSGNGTKEITVDVTANTSQSTTWRATLNEGNKWTNKISNLYYYDGNGQPIEYSLTNLEVTENGVPNKYELKDTKLTGDADDGYVVTLENDEVTTEISGKKTWDDNDDQDGYRPAFITIRLLADGVEVESKEVTEADGWAWEFTDLPKYNDDGTEIQYTVTEDAIDHYTTEYDDDDIINRHTKDQTSVTVVKIWDDKDDQDGIQPQSITVELLADGDSTGKTLTLDESNNWVGTFTELDMYHDHGMKIAYTVKEVDVPEGYEVEILGDATTGYRITNSHEPETIDISGEKTWDDSDDKDKVRPESITINLYADGEKALDKDGNVITATVTASDGWKWSFTDLPKYRDHGEEIVYTITEDPVDDYLTDIDGFNVVNTLIDPKLSKEVAEDDYERKEESGEHMHDGEDTGGDGWGTWDDADNNQEVTYHLKVTDIKGIANLTVHDYLEEGIDFESDTVEISLVDGGKETALTEGTDYTLSEGDCSDPECPMDGCTFEAKFDDDLFKDVSSDAYLVITYKALTDTHEADYDDYEDDLLNYSYMVYGANPLSLRRSDVVTAETDLFGFGIYKYADEFGTEVALAGAEFNLERDGEYATFETETDEDTEETYYMVTGWVEDKDSATTLTSDVDGMIRIEGLDDDTYKINETKAPVGYEIVDETITVIVDEDGVVTADGDTGSKEAVIGHVVDVENTLTLTEVKGSKTWDDENNQDGKRPDKIIIHLLANGDEVDSKTVTEADDWKWSFEDLRKYQDGVEIVYTITEEEVDGYTTVVNGYDVTNSYTPGKVGLNVQKIWDDKDDQDGIRPAEVTVKLLKNGEETGSTKTLDESNEWSASFTDLDEYTDGEKNEYSVEEISVEGYTDTVTSIDDTTSFIITNTHTPKEETPETGGPGTGGNGGPKTGDTNNIGLWLALLVAAIAAVLVAVRMRRRS